MKEGVPYPLDHVGIAVKDLERACRMYGELFGLEVTHRETVGSQNVNVVFLKAGETKLELLSPLNQESTVTRFIEKRGEGIHHLAFRVEDIQVAMARMADDGYRLLSDEPVKGAAGKLVCFLHPKSTGGVLIELCQPE